MLLFNETQLETNSIVNFYPGKFVTFYLHFKKSFGWLSLVLSIFFSISRTVSVFSFWLHINQNNTFTDISSDYNPADTNVAKTSWRRRNQVVTSLDQTRRFDDIMFLQSRIEELVTISLNTVMKHCIKRPCGDVLTTPTKFQKLKIIKIHENF